MPRMQADENLYYHRSTYQKGEEFEVLDTDVKALEDQGLAHIVKAAEPKQEKSKSEPKAQSDKKPEAQTPLSQMNRTELEAHATSLGMEDLDQYDTKAKLVEAIEAKQ